MALDIHAHLYPQPYIDFLRRRGGASRPLAERLSNVVVGRSRFMTGAISERLELMSAARISRQVLSMPNHCVLAEDPAACRDHAVSANDCMADVCAQHPDRLAMFANLPLVDADAAVAELDRSTKEHGALGVTFPTHVLGRPLDWDGLEPVYSALEKRDLPIFIHPGPPPHEVSPSSYDDFNLTSGLYFPIEDANAVLRMVCGGVLERHPDLRVICPHLGGTIPFLFRRLDLHLHPSLPHPPSYYLKKVLYDTVSLHGPALRCACDTFGTERIVFGTDFPYEEMQHIMESVDQLEVSQAERDGILEENVTAWLPDWPS